jgi:hypothetical protein
VDGASPGAPLQIRPALHHLAESPRPDAKKGAFDRLLDALTAQAIKLGLLSPGATAAIDTTGLDSHYTSHYFCLRAERRRRFEHFLKLALVCDIRSQFILAASVTRGPSNDSPQFPLCLPQAAARLRLRRVLADAAFDCEEHHRLCHENLGIAECLIPVQPRNTTRWPETPYRHAMKRAFPKQRYGQRWQVESVVSRLKRRITSSLTSRTPENQAAEALLIVLTYDLMIVLLYAAPGRIRLAA